MFFESLRAAWNSSLDFLNNYVVRPTFTFFFSDLPMVISNFFSGLFSTNTLSEEEIELNPAPIETPELELNLSFRSSL